MSIEINNPEKRVLICFTASYPFGLKETFFHNELPFLSEAFDKIYVLPTYNPSQSKNKRQVPDNVVCYDPILSSNKIMRIVLGLFNSSPVSYHFHDFFKGKVYLSLNKTVVWGNSLLTFRAKYRFLKAFLRRENIPSDSVMYSYWAGNPVLLTPMFRKYTKVVRMHRGDYYLDENNGYLPLRQAIYDNADLLIPISQHIQQDLISSYLISPNKIQVHRLGTSDKHVLPGHSQLKYPQDIIRIVSCSRVDPVKRLGLIVEALEFYKGRKKVEWHHFGDGLEFVELKNKVANFKNINVKVTLHGWTSQDDIYHFYNTHFVHWFVNVSASEGIPVSIMEAMSFGIPVIATDVGGSSEIVNKNTGYLLEKSFEVSLLTKYIFEIDTVMYMQKRKLAKDMWIRSYNAENNYRKLSSTLLSFSSKGV